MSICPPIRLFCDRQLEICQTKCSPWNWIAIRTAADPSNFRAGNSLKAVQLMVSSCSSSSIPDSKIFVVFKVGFSSFPLISTSYQNIKLLIISTLKKVNLLSSKIVKLYNTIHLWCWYSEEFGSRLANRSLRCQSFCSSSIRVAFRARRRRCRAAARGCPLRLETNALRFDSKSHLPLSASRVSVVQILFSQLKKHLRICPFVNLGNYSKAKSCKLIPLR